MLIENATEAVHDARRRHRREIAERTRLRRLVERVDVVIAACEEAHLQGLKEVPEDLATRSDRLFTTARRVVRLTGDAPALESVEATCKRAKPRIVDVMDSLWTIQEIVFDLMLPWRTELPEDVEPGSVQLTGSSWRYDAA